MDLVERSGFTNWGDYRLYHNKSNQIKGLVWDTNMAAVSSFRGINMEILK